MLVVNTTSPKAGSTWRVAAPGNQVPSSSKTKAGRPVMRSPRDLETGSLLGLGRRRLGRRRCRRILRGRGLRGSGLHAGGRLRSRRLSPRCGGGRLSRRGAGKPHRARRRAAPELLLERAARAAPRNELERQRKRQEDPAAPPGGLGQNGDRLSATEHGVAGATSTTERGEPPALSGLQEHHDREQESVENQQHQQEVEHASTKVADVNLPDRAQDSGLPGDPSTPYAPIPTIPAHPSGVRLAPPTRTPSRSGSASSASALPGFTLPPYSTETGPGHPCRPRWLRMKRWTSAASRGVAFFPVPMAQTGSYATTTFARSPAWVTSAATGSSWRRTASSVRPASRSARVSPTQRSGVTPAARAAFTLSALCSSVSPNRWRRSECPTSVSVAPASVTSASDSSPVNAPLASQWMFWAPTLMSGRWRNASTRGASDTAGGKNHSARWSAGRVSSRNRAANSHAAAGPCAFSSLRRR